MILLLFFVFVPAARLITLRYRSHRLKVLKKIYEDFVFDQSSVNINLYRAELLSMMETNNVIFNFSNEISASTIKHTMACFDYAEGNIILEKRNAVLPNTYFKILANLPYAISRKIGINPSKALTLVIYILYIGFGCLDLSTAIYKLIDFLV